MKIKLFITALLTLTACNQSQNTHHHVVVASGASAVANPDIAIKVDLPIYLDGVPSLIHPVVVSAVDEYATKSYSSEKISSHIHVDLASYQLSGKIFNLVFENKETGETKPLFSHNTQLIHQAKYLIYSYFDDTTNNSQNKQNHPLKRKFYRHFVYQVQERLDEKAPFHLEQALYLSNEKGEHLQKLHSDKEFLLETRWLPEINRYYFTTKSDSNADGKITLTDQAHNYYIDFSDVEKPVVKAYDVMPK